MQYLAARISRWAADLAARTRTQVRAFAARLAPRVSQWAGALRDVISGFVRRLRGMAPPGRVPFGSAGQGSQTAPPWWRRPRFWAGVALAGVLATAVWLVTFGPVRPGDDKTVELYIAPGQTTTRIGADLASLGLVRNPGLFRIWVQVTGNAGKLKAGEYQLSRSMSVPRIAAKLARGQVKLYPVTIPEGYNVAEITQTLIAKGFADRDRLTQALATIATNGTLPAELQPERPAQVKQSLEGFLFPDTYSFHRGITEVEILRAMANRFKAALTPDMKERAAELGMSINEVVTLASIIEKEARKEEERAVISGVFHNRLRLRMALQSCATVRYVMKDPAGPITDREMAMDDVYNTYVYPGLPPGPICSPGLASIHAALYPEQTDYLYFCAKPDGSHAFARTLAEHNANVRKYLQ